MRNERREREGMEGEKEKLIIPDDKLRHSLIYFFKYVICIRLLQ
jgi:hypothetical protein